MSWFLAQAYDADMNLIFARYYYALDKDELLDNVMCEDSNIAWVDIEETNGPYNKKEVQL